MAAIPNEQVITEVNAREYFQDAVQSALSNQRLRVCDETVVYVTNLLTSFIHSERLYEHTDDGYGLRPLYSFFNDAMEASSLSERDRNLRRLGDVSLFISGMFSESLSRSLVDVDYYIAMGGNAYGSLADSERRGNSKLVMKEVFAELADRFEGLVDVLSEVSENNHISRGKDVLRLYEVWLATGSKRAAEKLEEQGVYPISSLRCKH